MKKGLLLFLPAAIWLFLFLIVPLILIFIYSFLSRDMYGSITYQFTLSNYERFFEWAYLRIFLRTILYSFLVTITCLLLAYPFAWQMSCTPKRIRSILLVLLMIPFWTNSLVRTFAWMTLLRTEGIINSFLISTGIIESPFPMLFNEGAIMIGLFYVLFPFMVLPLYVSMDKLDANLLEAAADLGAGSFHRLIHITIPLTMPGIVSGSLIVFISSSGMFAITDLMGGAKIMFLGNLILNQFLSARNWPFGSAVSTILVFISLIFIIFYLYISRKEREDS